MAKLSVTVLDMQPIEPPIGGGRLRLLGLYSGFKNNIDVTYIGSYDWRGPEYRDHMLSECMREITVPLSEEHFKAHDELSAMLGKVCIDIAFPVQGHLSVEYVKTLQQYTKSADIVVLSHPWVFPFAVPVIDRSKQLLVYDSQNHEGLLRIKLIDDGSEIADKVIREAVRSEWELCHAADLILACSQEDKQSFIDIYGINADKIIIVPNGVFTEKLLMCKSQAAKDQLRERLGLKLPTACFIGSNYYPNEEAARLVLEISRDLPQYHFVIIGGVGQALDDVDRNDYPNVTITGFVDEEEKQNYLHAGDVAINPMLSGSGTNIKMFDFMAAGIPIITTDIGARGIADKEGNLYVLCRRSKESLVKEITGLITDKKRREQLRIHARNVVCEKYSWEQISYELGYKLAQKYREHINSDPVFISVIVPTFERPEHLKRLLKNLKKQTFKNFEVIIIDQSEKTFNALPKSSKMDVIYLQTSVLGAVKARNTGISLARGKIAAFIDDDCIPDDDWLENASGYFENPDVAGVEGLVAADIYDMEKYRVVSNLGMEGVGFITANLFIRLDVLKKIGGFDESFDNPHFREDTDLGWRALKIGKIPYARDVVVVHPSHKRNTVRESVKERSKFFVHDPLLLKKHPDKYIELFLLEPQHYSTPEYWCAFMEGLERHKAFDKLSDFLSDSRVRQVKIPYYIWQYGEEKSISGELLKSEQA